MILLNPKLRNKRVHTFPKGICPKKNITARLEFELANFQFAVQPLRHGDSTSIQISFGLDLRQLYSIQKELPVV